MSPDFKYFIIYKPFGMLSQFSKTEKNESSLADLNCKFDKDIYPAGRLDKDSEGLLLLSNDSLLKNRIMDPKFEHKKTYWVQVEGEITEEAIHKLANGTIEIKLTNKTHLCKKAKVKKLSCKEVSILPKRTPPIRERKSIPTSWIEIELSEGKNRQIRKMTAKVGFPTLRLIRVAIENMFIENLGPGDVRVLEKKELPFQ